MKKLRNTGFTLVELMIATSVFSVILLVCTYGLMQIGTNYYKGTTIIRTQNVARAVMDDISQAIQYGSSEPTYTGAGIVAQLPSSPSTKAFCIGSKRYTYNSTVVQGTSHALVVDTAPSVCTPQSFGGGPVNGKEMLGKNMRLTMFSIIQTGDDYNISIKVSYGDNDLLNLDTASPNYGSCLGGRGSQFCAASKLQTTVHRRLGS